MEALGRDRMRVLDRPFRNDRNGQHGDPPRAQNAPQFREGPLIVIDMLEDVRGKDEIERLAPERQVSDVGPRVDATGGEIGRYVSGEAGRQVLPDYGFRREVERCCCATVVSGEEFVEDADLEAMALECAATWATRIAPRPMFRALGKEPPRISRTRDT